MLSPGPTGKTRADGVRSTFLRGAVAMQELVGAMVSERPYRIAGLIDYGTNLFHTIPNVPRTKEALAKLDLVVAIDVLPQDHLAWADIVLPEAAYLERYDDLLTMSHKTPYIAMREPAAKPYANTKPGWWIAKELGRRIGLETFFPFGDVTEYLDTRLASIGQSLDTLRAAGGILVQAGQPYLETYAAAGKSPFPTESGKVELYSAGLARAGHDPLPRYEPIAEPPEGYYRLLYGRHPAHTFAKTQSTPLLHQLFSENEVWVNSGEARANSIADGERVWLVNQDGARSGPVKVRATERIRRDAVYLVHGYGHASPWMPRADGHGASDTALQTRYALDPISGSAGMRVNSVRLVRA